MIVYLRLHRFWVFPLIILALITPFSADIDLSLSRYFFTRQEPHGFRSSPFNDFMYVYGLVPAQLLFISSAVLLFMSCFFKRWKRYYTPSLILVLTLVIGSGLITHALLKDHFGRPRPKQVTEFGGHQEFLPFYKPNFFNQLEPSKSFPSGHATMGFYFFTLAIIGLRFNNKKIFISGMILAIVLGVALSLTRIEQGGHFFSDTLISCLIMWWTALICNYYIKDEGKFTVV